MSKQGVLLMNLGSPDSTKVSDVRRYLREFLMDGRVLDAPYPIRFFVVHGLILPFRPRQSAEAYEQIWTKKGSPLIVTSTELRQSLQAEVSIPISLAMRYRKPSAAEALRELMNQGVDEVLLIPLFPHYAMSSFETAVEHVRQEIRRLAPGMELIVQPPYFDRPDYLQALVARARPYLDQGYDHFLFSFHGIPERHLKKSDPTGQHCLCASDCCDQQSPALATCYRAQCFKTAKEFVRLAGLQNHSIAFQSRLGRDPWLKPYTDFELERLAQSGVRKLLVICPAFVADCLETLEEIGMRGRESFLNAGGKEFELIPCLNTHPAWVNVLGGMVREFTPAG